MKNKDIKMASLLTLALLLFVACQPIMINETMAVEVAPAATQVAVEEGHTHEEGEDHSHEMSDEMANGEMHLMDNLGSHEHAISTNSEMTQQYFNQGLILAYAFNHELAIASFQQALQHDPACAMCYWGIAWALGPNINLPMDNALVPDAWAALQQAQQLAPNASKQDQAYINALAARYAAEPVEDRAPLDLAFADAMRQVAAAYPDDMDAATIFAESLMDTIPWNYWTPEGEPRPATVEILAALEQVLEVDPRPSRRQSLLHSRHRGIEQTRTCPRECRTA